MSSRKHAGNVNRIKPAVKRFIESEETDLDFVKQCFWELKAQFDACGKKINRWASLGLLFVCIFELINRKLIKQASFSFIEVNHLSFLLYVLPPLVILSFVNLLGYAIEQDLYDKMVRQLALQKFPGFLASGILGLFFMQQGTLTTDIPSSLNVYGRGIFIYTGFQEYTVPLCYLSFTVYAYIQIFMHSAAILPAMLSLGVTIVLLAIVVDIIYNRASKGHTVVDYGVE